MTGGWSILAVHDSFPSSECISRSARAWLSSVREDKRPQGADGFILV